MSGIRVRGMAEQDWPAVKAIYTIGVETGHATFETAPPATWDEFSESKRLDLCLVAINSDDRVLAWVGATPVSTRHAYRGVVEHSIYVHPEAGRRQVGTQLLTEFITLADQEDIWTIQSSVFPENTASLRLHERAGFRAVGRRERIAERDYGPLAGTWRDTILIERRKP